MNKVILMGRLTRDPEVRYSQSGQAVCRYTLAVNRSYKREGEPDADFFNVIAFAQRGEFAGKYFRKGMMVAICGELRNSSYEQNGVKRYVTDIIVTDQYFAESKASYEGRSQGGSHAQQSGGYQNYQSVAPQNNNFAPQNNGFAPQGNPYQQPSYGAAPMDSQTGASGPEGFTPVDATLEGDADLPF